MIIEKYPSLFEVKTSKPTPSLPVFASRTLARAWAAACGVPIDKIQVSGSPGRWSSVLGPPRQPSCLFCRRLGGCNAPVRQGCGFLPRSAWPRPAQLF